MAEQHAAAGRWEHACQHLRTAVRLLNTRAGTDEFAGPRPEQRDHTAHETAHDDRTAIENHRYLHEQLGALHSDPRIAGLGVALLDVDLFGQVNDTYGHAFGDAVLQRLVAVLDCDLPAGAFCLRYGAEECAIVLPHHEQHAAVRVCEEARERVERHPWYELAPDLRVTVSAGVAHASGPATGVDGLVATASALLRAAKGAGRNAVAFQDPWTGAVRLAGLAGDRRAIPQPLLPTPACRPGPPAP